MTKEESIALAEKLQKDYANLDALKDQIRRNEAEIKSKSEAKIPGHSFFHYFWPTLIIAPVLYMGVKFIHNLGFRYSSNDVQYTLINLRFFLSVGSIIVGAVVAGRKKANNNSQIEYAMTSNRKTINELVQANEDNKKKIVRLEAEVNQYSDIVPGKHRTKTAMFKVISMLKTGKAEDFESALKQL